MPLGRSRRGNSVVTTPGVWEEGMVSTYGHGGDCVEKRSLMGAVTCGPGTQAAPGDPEERAGRLNTPTTLPAHFISCQSSPWARANRKLGRWGGDALMHTGCRRGGVERAESGS